MAVEPKTLNLISSDSDIYSRWIMIPNVFEPLLGYDFDSGELVGCLAESYEVSSDKLEVKFRLRDDIHFSDGVKVTADDVIFTYRTIMDANVDAAAIAGYYGDVEEAVKVDERVVKFRLKKRYFKAVEMHTKNSQIDFFGRVW